MSVIWSRSGGRWRQLTAVGFRSDAGGRDEGALERLIAEAPDLLPLAGAPRLAIIGQQVAIEGGRIDLLAVENNGRLVIIEVKLRENQESRRSIVGQALSYASYLRGLTEQGLCDLVGRSEIWQSASELFEESNHVTPVQFSKALQSNLAAGAFRLVMVIDDPHPQLRKLVGYLEGVTKGQLQIDLVSVSRFVVNGEEVVVPQLVESVQSAPAEPWQPLTLVDEGIKRVTPWDQEALIQELKRSSSPTLETRVRRIFDWAGQRQLILEGNRGLTYPGIAIKIALEGRREPLQLLKVWAGEAYGYPNASTVQIHLNHLARTAPFTEGLEREALYLRLAQATGADAESISNVESLWWRDQDSTDGRADLLIQALDYVVDRLRKPSPPGRLPA